MQPANLLSICALEERLSTIRPKRASIEDDLVTQQMRRKQQEPVYRAKSSTFRLALFASEELSQAEEPASPSLLACTRKDSNCSCFTFASPTPLAIEPVSSQMCAVPLAYPDEFTNFDNFRSFGEICVGDSQACFALHSLSTDISLVRESAERLAKLELETLQRNLETNCKRAVCARDVYDCSKNEYKKINSLHAAKERLFKMVLNIRMSP